MQTDRRTILALVASGRITPAEAERLLAHANEGRETAGPSRRAFGALLLKNPSDHILSGFSICRHGRQRFPAQFAQIQVVLTRGIGGTL